MEQIISKENMRIKRVCKILNDKNEREISGSFVAEGVRLCEDAYTSGIAIREAFATETALKKHPELLRVLEKAQEAFLVSEAAAAKISDTKNPQGIFLVCEKRDNSRPAHHAPKARYLLLASLQDPGNVGSIIRTAEAFGLDGIAMSSDCPELYSPKVLRAAMGGAFRLRIWVVPDIRGEIAKLKRENVKVFAAALGESSAKLGELRFESANAVVLGNEGAGLEQSVIEECDASVMIPMAGRADSLGVAMAAGIIAWEMLK